VYCTCCISRTIVRLFSDQEVPILRHLIFFLLGRSCLKKVQVSDVSYRIGVKFGRLLRLFFKEICIDSRSRIFDITSSLQDMHMQCIYSIDGVQRTGKLSTTAAVGPIGCHGRPHFTASGGCFTGMGRS